MSAVIAVDPGPETSALLEWFPERGHIGLKETSFRNEALCDLLEAYKPLQLNGSIRTELVVEKVVNYGMIVGAEVFETVFWSGRPCESWQRGTGLPYHRLPRMDVKMHLCHDSRAKDKNIRQALIDRFGPGKEKAIGLKYSPGPLYVATRDKIAGQSRYRRFGKRGGQKGRKSTARLERKTVPGT